MWAHVLVCRYTILSTQDFSFSHFVFFKMPDLTVVSPFVSQNCAIICEGSAYFGTEYSSEVRGGRSMASMGWAI